MIMLCPENILSKSSKKTVILKGLTPQGFQIVLMNREFGVVGTFPCSFRETASYTHISYARFLFHSAVEDILSTSQNRCREDKCWPACCRELYCSCHSLSGAPAVCGTHLRCAGEASQICEFSDALDKPGFHLYGWSNNPDSPGFAGLCVTQEFSLYSCRCIQNQYCLL